MRSASSTSWIRSTWPRNSSGVVGAVGLVLGVRLGAEGLAGDVEGDRDVRGLLVAQQVDQHRGEAVDRVGGLPGRGARSSPPAARRTPGRPASGRRAGAASGVARSRPGSLGRRPTSRSGPPAGPAEAGAGRPGQGAGQAGTAGPAGRPSPIGSAVASGAAQPRDRGDPPDHLRREAEPGEEPVGLAGGRRDRHDDRVDAELVGVSGRGGDQRPPRAALAVRPARPAGGSRTPRAGRAGRPRCRRRRRPRRRRRRSRRRATTTRCSGIGEHPLALEPEPVRPAARDPAAAHRPEVGHARRPTPPTRPRRPTTPYAPAPGTGTLSASPHQPPAELRRGRRPEYRR